MLVDSHCHLDFEAFDDDRAEVLDRCVQKAVSAILIPGVNPVQNLSLQTLIDGSARDVELYSGVGLHPYWLPAWVKEQGLDRCSPDSAPVAEALKRLQDSLVKNSAHSSCVAVGEIGLDSTIAVDLEWQQKVLLAQLEVAVSIGKPVILHVRNTHNSMVELLKYHRVLSGGQIHGFTGSTQLARSYWKLGFRIGVGGSITYERAAKTRRTVTEMPLESLLLETDSPDMPLSGFQGMRNSPIRVVDVARELADLRKVSNEVIGKATTQNFYDLYRAS